MNLRRFLVNRARKRSGVAGIVVALSVGIILFATVGFLALQILATAGTTSFQPAVVILGVVVVPIAFALAVAISMLKHAGLNI